MAVRGSVCGLLGLCLLAAVPAFASLSPASWVSHRLIGIKHGNWVALRAERHYASYYQYRTKSEVQAVAIRTGCRATSVVLREEENIDQGANGTW